MTISLRLVVAVAMFAVFAGMVGVSLSYPPDARFLPLVVGVPGTALAAIQVAVEIVNARGGYGPAAVDGESRATRRRELLMFAWTFGYIAAVIPFGILPATTVFLFAFHRFDQGESAKLSLAIAAGGFVVLYGVFDVLLKTPLFEGLLLQALPV
jgi:hypothetical protein